MIRAIEPTDADALTRMMSRCSPGTRYLRFHGVVTEIPPAYLRRCLSGEHTALVAEVDGEIVGLASIGPVSGACGANHGHGTTARTPLGACEERCESVVPEEPDVSEAAAIVEDGWQGRGVGRALVAALVAKTGVAVLRMEVCRTPLLTYLTENLPVLASQQHGCDVTIDVDVRSLSQ
jgi:GNAT superfamily N-acetyltransferase